MARLPELFNFRKEHGLRLISIKQLIEYRHQREKLVEEIFSQPYENQFGQFQLRLFRSLTDHRINFALTHGELGPEPTLVRVQSENILADVFSGDGEAEGRGVALGMQRIAAEPSGVLLYMTQPCAGLELPKELPEAGAGCSLEPASMDFRGYGIGAQILASLGLKQIRLLSNSQRKHVGLDAYGLEIVEQVKM